MKAQKATVYILDHEGFGKDAVKDNIECGSKLSLHVTDVEEIDIGEWTDEHPLNKTKTCDATFRMLFGTTQLASQKEVESFDKDFTQVRQLKDEVVYKNSLIKAKDHTIQALQDNVKKLQAKFEAAEYARDLFLKDNLRLKRSD